MYVYNVSMSKPLSLVAIGGGGGAGQVLRGAAPYFARRSAIVAVTDTGRSTGVARAVGRIPAPGDVRATIAALARSPDDLWPRLLERRFQAPDHPALDGMAFGNLLIAALAQQLGDFGQAVAYVAQLAGTDAAIIPASSADTQLCAELADGSVVRGEVAVRGLGKPPIRRLFLDPPAAASPAALAAIASADLIALGPGSFFTSLLATLQFAGLVEALRATPAQVVLIGNSTTQPGQTDDLGALDHVRHLVRLLGPGTLDAIILNRSPDLNPALIARYAADGLHLITPSDAEIAAIADLGVRPLVADYIDRGSGPRALWNKQDTIRFDMAQVGAALAELLNQNH